MTTRFITGMTSRTDAAGLLADFEGAANIYSLVLYRCDRQRIAGTEVKWCTVPEVG